MERKEDLQGAGDEEHVVHGGSADSWREAGSPVIGDREVLEGMDMLADNELHTA